ncbi:hypothetical protein GGR20_003096 [Devosia subaequoris]|uniref:Uncharacterized protein n=1 Tax=Devosia subaequoris TaxID=395930 RepID=A0A7W6IQP9_9HYPH|nr:hypothetical protein [Devosia subaequoris]
MWRYFSHRAKCLSLVDKTIVRNKSVGAQIVADLTHNSATVKVWYIPQPQEHT